MTPPASWARTWRIIRYCQEHRTLTAGQKKDLDAELLRMDSDQRRRFNQETGGNLVVVAT